MAPTGRVARSLLPASAHVFCPLWARYTVPLMGDGYRAVEASGPGTEATSRTPSAPRASHGQVHGHRRDDVVAKDVRLDRRAQQDEEEHLASRQLHHSVSNADSYAMNLRATRELRQQHVQCYGHSDTRVGSRVNDSAVQRCRVRNNPCSTGCRINFGSGEMVLVNHYH